MECGRTSGRGAHAEGDEAVRALYLSRYGTERASSRVRVFQMADHLRASGIDAHVITWGDRPTRASQVAFARDVLVWARRADVIILQKPAYPAVFVDALAAINPRIVVDFDDAVWAPPAGEDPAAYRAGGLRLHRAIARARWVTVGSRVLADAVRRGFPSARVHVLPSPVDIAAAPARDHDIAESPVAGWVGSAENLRDFDPVKSGIADLANEMTVRIVSSAGLDVRGVEFTAWSIESAAREITSFDIGLMPLRDDERSRGRCGFKAIEYMSAGLPVVASDVGAAAEVVEQGVTGFVERSASGWVRRVRELCEDPDLRARMGAAGRERARSRFSYAAVLPEYASFLQDRLSDRGTG
jgi:glycosyltransferase involved in cell wall biosynthesis